MKKVSILGFLIFINIILSGCSDSNKNTFQGYIEGEYVYLSTSSSGKLEKVLTERGKTVKSGDMLFSLENEYENYSLQQAEQELNQAKAQAENYLVLFSRNERLFKRGSISQQAFDDSRTNATSSSAKIKSAEAAVAKAKWELDQRTVSAPTDGLIYDVLFRQGERVTAGSPVIQMLSNHNVKIRFFVPETVIGKVRIGEQAQVTVDGIAEPLMATISYVAGNAEYTPPIIYSNETRSKLVFMVEATPEPSIALSLHPGQPVSVSLP